MKIFYLIPAIFLILFMGCSSIYRISNFSSKDKFYEDFNKSAGSKTIKVIMNNDSSFICENGAKIENDTLYYFGLRIDTIKMTINLSDILEKYYTNLSHTSALLTLNNGEKFNAKQIEIKRDSIYFIYTKTKIITGGVSAIKNIKNVSYKNHWLGLPAPVVFGTLTGFIVGLPVGYILSQPGHLNNDRPMAGTNSQNEAGVYSLFGLTAIGLVSGSILGWINGYTYIYQFNP